MRGPGMWMPKQKDGKNWKVDYEFTFKNGEVKGNNRKFRVRADAQRFVQMAKDSTSRDDRLAKTKFKISKI